MRKIIFSDLDGTLINRQQTELHEGNFEAIKRWREAGNLFVLCTGRNTIDILPTLKKTHLEYDYLVLCNGAGIYDASWNKINEMDFPLELGKQILEVCSQEKELITFYSDEKELILKTPEGLKKLDKTLLQPISIEGNFMDYVNQATCFKLLCIIQMEGNDLLKHYESVCLKGHEGEISWFFNTDCIDMMGGDVSKGKGMMRLVEYLDIDLDGVYAIGDSFNDLSMIEMAGHGCTFPHCPDILKKASCHIVSSVCELINKILDKKL